MATLERGKGKRKQVVTVTRHGRALCLEEVEAGHARLSGYRSYPNEASATAALAADVRTWLSGGMQAVDEEARAIAATQQTAARPPSLPLPLRQDLAIYNEATGFVVTSRRMAGRTLDEGSAEWKKAVVKGELLPLTLVQDDPFVIRIVAGEPLTPQEDDEWVARVDWHLNVPDGKLCVTGGSVFTNDGYDGDDPSHEQYVGQVAIPKGRYRAALYSHVHGVNGGYVLDHLAGGPGGSNRGEPLESWFARTRPAETPAADGAVEYVDFLLHLEPIDAAPKSGLSTLPDEGWFSGYENARKPDRCPLGLAGRDIVRSISEAPGRWTYVREACAQVPAQRRRAVPGGPVALPLASVGRAARIAWLGSRFTTIELRLTPPANAALTLTAPWPEGIVLVERDGEGRVLFDADLDINEILRRLPSLADLLSSTPDGTRLDLCCAPLETLPDRPTEAGLLSLRGEIRAGTWHIAEAYPGTSAATLAAALSLARISNTARRSPSATTKKDAPSSPGRGARSAGT